MKKKKVQKTKPENNIEDLMKELIKKTLSIVILMIGIIILMSMMIPIKKIENDDLFMGILCVIIMMVFAIFILMSSKKDIKNRLDSHYEYRSYLVAELERDGIYKSDETIVNKKEKNDTSDSVSNNEINEQRKKDMIALMLKSYDEITGYFKISKSQARYSFWFSVISCIVGMVALGIGIYGIIILQDISVSVISLISGSISELISGTVFWVHNKSALQLNHYYDALHENEKFLSAVNIADKLSAEKREDVLTKIIYKQIDYEPLKNEIENIMK